MRGVKSNHHGMKSARVRNFKLLRDVAIDFGDDPERPLTVIRAENGSGKTSTLLALQWGLYGQDGLVGRKHASQPNLVAR